MGIGMLPGTLIEAVQALEEDLYIQNVLGDHICRRYLEAKKAEWTAYRTQVTSWEIGEYLYKI